MCRSLGDIRGALARFAEDFDAGVLSGADASALAADASAIEKMAAAVKVLAAARAAETGEWRRAGDRSAAHHLARTSGSSVGQAVEALATARRLEALSATGAAARRGEVSLQQAAVIAQAAEADPSAETKLLARAADASLGELRDDCAHVRASSGAVDLEARRAAIHRGRHLRSYTDADGVWHLRVRNTPEVGAAIMAALAPRTDRNFREARAAGRRESLDAYAADALTQALTAAGDDDVERPARTAVNAKIIVRVDLAALLRGYPTTGEVCDIVGFGPVAVSAVRDMIATTDPFLAALATNGAAVAGVAHLGRRPTSRQRTSLEWLFPACAVLGCPAQSHLQTDHRVDWADSHITMVDLLDRLCHHHHQLKTRDGWALVDGSGKRPFVPPGDPRHPRYSRHPQAARGWGGAM